MANRYWVNGAGNWSDDTNHWATTSGGAPGAGNLPTSADNAIFNSASSGAAYTVTIDASASCLDLTFTAPATGNVTWAGSSGLSIYGSLTTYAALIFSFSGNLTFAATSGPKTITTNGISFFGDVTFDGVGGSWQLQDSLTVGILATLFLTNGSLDTNNKTLSCGIFFSDNSNVRSLSLGSSTFNVRTTWATITTTNFTFNTGTSTINFNYSGVIGKTINGGGFTYYNFNFNHGAGTGSLTITGSNTFRSFAVSSSAAFTLSFTSSTTQTIQTFSVSGSSGKLITVSAVTAGTFFNLSVANGIVSSDYLSIKDCHALGGATFYAGTHSTNVSGNTGWRFTGVPSATKDFMLLLP